MATGYWVPGKECPFPSFEAFKNHLNKASFHYADDSGREWFTGNAEVEKAIDIAIQNRYDYRDIKRMFDVIKPLVDLDSFMSKMLLKLYKTA